MNWRRGRLAVLRAEVATIVSELRNDRGGRSKADVEFLEGVVVDQIELDILVAATLPCFGRGFAQQIHLGAVRSSGRRLLATFAFGLGDR